MGGGIRPFADLLAHEQKDAQGHEEESSGEVPPFLADGGVASPAI